MAHTPGNIVHVPADRSRPPEWAKGFVKPRARTDAMAVPAGGSYLTILAHSDDELIFINPDLHPSITAGLPSRTIYLTADEDNGWPEQGLTREEFAARLHGGTREAYAVLAGQPNNWIIDAITVAGKLIERNTLQGAPHVQLYWINLPDGGDPLYLRALMNMWDDPAFRSITIVPTGSPVTEVQDYNSEELLAVLVDMLMLFQPTTIRIQDPAPDQRYRGDHVDHIAAAYFGQLAVKAYEGPAPTQQCLLLRYRCYNTENSPVNVPPALAGAKMAAFNEYKKYLKPPQDAWDGHALRNHQRFPVTEPFVIKDGTGALHAVVVGGDNVIAWRQNAGSTTWSAPTILISGSFVPGVAMELNQDGTVQLAVYSWDTFDIRTTRQTAPGGGFGTWESLGSPGDVIGVPALGRNVGGCLEMYALNSAGGISNAFQSTPNGPITGWDHISGGPNVLGQPTVFLSSNDLLNVFADNNGQIAHWTQPPGEGTSPDPDFPAVETVGTPSPAMQGNDNGILVIREHGDGALGISRESSPGGTWSGLEHINGQGGIGPSFGVRSGSGTGGGPRVFAFARNDNYGISMSKQDTAGNFGPWTDLGGYCEIGPAAVLDNAGIVRLLVVGGDCRLYERRQTAAGPDAPFTAWQVVGV